MVAVKAFYDGRVFVPEGHVSAKINQEAIITLLDPQPAIISSKEQLLNLAGRINHEDYLEMEKALEETERVYPNEW